MNGSLFKKAIAWNVLKQLFSVKELNNVQIFDLILIDEQLKGPWIGEKEVT